MKRLLSLLSLVWLFGCQTTEIPGKAYFSVKLDADWNDADSIAIAWVRQPGDTSLVYESLRTEGMDTVLILADGYEGGATTLILRGFAQGGLIHFQVREYDGVSRTVSQVENKDVSPPSVRLQPVSPRSIGDSVAFSALAEGHGKPLRAYAWDYQSDGQFDDGGILSDTVAPLAGGFRYAKAGEYVVKLRISDAWGVVRSDSVKVAIRQDVPTANAGPDLEARRLSKVTLRGIAYDTLGRIVKREWKIGQQGFQEADSTGVLIFTAPDTTGTWECVFRATDDDGQIATDSLDLTLLSVSDPILSPLLPADTTITIGDSLTFSTTATQGTAGLATIAWDLGTGSFASPLPIARGALEFKQGVRFSGAKSVTIRAKLTDSAGRIANAASALVKVVIDSPKVHAGADTLVPVGGIIRLHGQVSDGIGRIVRTEWRIGGSFRVASPDTQFAAATPGTFDFELRAVDDDGLVAVDTVRVTVTASTSATLTELSLIGIAFDTAFQPNRYIYSASVGNSVSSVKVKASVATNSGATLKVKGAPLASGGTTTSISLNVGINLIDVQVTAQDTSVHQNYLISVNRAANGNASLQSLLTSLGAVIPAFKDTVYSYTVQAPYRTRAVTVTAVPAATTTKLTLNGSAFTPNKASDSIPLTEARTQIRIGTVAEAGNALTYTITVIRDTASDEVVSDFENRSPMNSLGGVWSFFDDSPNGGNSKVLSSDTASPTPVIDSSSFAAGHASSGALAFGFRFGTVKPVTCGGTCTFPNYVGLSTAFMPFADSSADLTGAKAITFFAKADTAMILRFAVKTLNVKDFGFYQALITVTKEWKQFTVYLRQGSGPEELAQPNWANVAPFVLSKVTGLDIQISAEENTTLSKGLVLFDNLTLVGWRRP